MYGGFYKNYKGGSNMATKIYYKPECQYCGKVGGGRHSGTPTGGIPNMTPYISGRCPSSPNGNHAPRWVIA